MNNLYQTVRSKENNCLQTKDNMELIISPQAENEIDDIYHYLFLRFSVDIADEKINGLYKSIFRLLEHPFMGRSLDGHDENLRILSSPPNVVIYNINDRVLEVLHVVDARTNYISNIFPDMK